MYNIIVLVLALSIVTGCTPAPNVKTVAVVTATLEAQALWTRYVTDDVPDRAIIDDGVIVFDALHLRGGTSVQAVDARTGKLLWKRAGMRVLPGSPLFLTVGASLERIDPRSGRTIWRSVPLCAETHPAANLNYTPPAVSVPTYGAIISSTIYVGCNGGNISALSLNSGHVLSFAHPAYVDNYDKIVSLGGNALGISGQASGAYMYRQSAIVKQQTLAPIVVFTPDHRILGARGASAIVADVCCQGAHSDSWPGGVELVSLSSGKTVSAVSLHPYAIAPPGDADRPGAGVLLAYGNTLYVATHSALFAYDVAHLRDRPRVLFNDLADLPSIVDERFLVMEERGPLNSRKTAVLDSHTGLLVTLPRANIDAGCRVRATGEKYAFAVCTSLDVPSRAQLGGSKTPVTAGLSTENPESIAVYALPGS